jgi:signal transduction histidine kinase
LPFSSRISLTPNRCDFGIPPENCDKIFNPFLYGEANRKSAGLRLSISYDHRMSEAGLERNGKIRVESEEGKFAELVVRRPLHRNPF